MNVVHSNDSDIELRFGNMEGKEGDECEDGQFYHITI